MSLTNDQITAKNFKEFYEAIRPYLNGSFPTAIANKFDKANMYSTDEQIVGRWIDGKPLYQKTFTIASMQKNGYEDVLTNVDHAHTVEKSYRRMQGGIDGDDFWYATNAYVNIRAVSMDDGTLRITNCSSELLTDIIITVQYTKTTDTAMEIGSDTDYSTTEKIIGTWIDGKPVYQKTYSVTGTYSGTMNDVISLPSDVDEFAHIEMFGVSNTGVYMPIPYVNNSSSAQASGYFISKSGGVFKVSLRFATASEISFSKLVFHVQYTKTTD